MRKVAIVGVGVTKFNSRWQERKNLESARKERNSEMTKKALDSLREAARGRKTSCRFISML